MSAAVDTPQPSLPTLDKLGVQSIPADLDVKKVASAWLQALSQHVSSNDIDGILDLFVDDPWWRDMLALTWEFRTFHGRAIVKKFLQDRLASSKFSSLKLVDALLETPYPDLAWIQGQFDFETDIGTGSGVFRLVPSSSGVWKGFTIYTNLESLKAFPESVGPRRNFLPNHGKWKSGRDHEKEFVESDPQVLIIGGGQSGLDVAARLKNLNVPTLVVEKNARIGDQWRYRYQALCLHDPVWYDHMPYLPFPPTWPVYTPAQKLANWLEYYAEALELNVWTSSTVTHAEQAADKKWIVTVQRGDGTERKFRVDHLIFAIGLGGGNPNIPNIPGQSEFQGQVLHSTEHKSARDHIGKKVVIIGASTSAHDIASDYVEHGVDVTMYQRDSVYVMSTKEGMPRMFGDIYWEDKYPVEVADRVNASIPIWIYKLLWQRITKDIAEADKATLDGLKKVGFKLNLGDDDAGFLTLAMRRGGGYYLDVGTSQLVIDGKIKLKSDSKLSRFTKTGLLFEDGSELPADVVLFATGFDSPALTIAKIVGEKVASQIKPLWGLNEEGELRTVWRDTGVPNLWFMMGNLSWCRFHSKHLALQIKAQQEGILGTRYE
ncbi:putative indole-3-pyruvate monooxygenase YUCCA8 [Grifola frondosa]|uniref:Putative indole-3-pyruvate monooxygenase YUCCA8 n=1 Tax=Grifola frondosa TaxID=5627 RepID=A0A1C7MSE3_GRIFR|nr:putative indole-3-pyruvate monooxygenase YUCCA8 [Grifola frondosa]